MRLFVGIAIPEPVGESLVDLTDGLPGADWVDPSTYHLTLRFIGEVGAAHAEEIDAALAEVAAPPFDLGLTSVAYFATAGRPRTLFAGVQPSPPLQLLARRVERAVVAADLLPEGRAFTPHVTLARLRDVSLAAAMGYVQAHALFRAPPFRVDHFTLFESRPGGSGAVYIPLADYPLGRDFLSRHTPREP